MNTKIDFKKFDLLHFEKKDSLNAVNTEMNCLSVSNAGRLISIFLKYAADSGIKDCEFTVQYVQNGLVMIFCKEHLDQDNTNIYLVAVCEQYVWNSYGWAPSVKFTVREDGDDVVISDEILVWKMNWEKHTKSLPTHYR